LFPRGPAQDLSCSYVFLVVTRGLFVHALDVMHSTVDQFVRP
jgi:hypothetical protein